METFSALLALWASPVDSPHKAQWRRALVFSWIWVWINGWVNSREAGDLRRHRAHYDDTAMTHVTLWRGNDIRLTGPFWRESNGHQWVTVTKEQWFRALMSSLFLARTSCRMNILVAGNKLQSLDLLIGRQDRNSSNGHQDDIPYCDIFRKCNGIIDRISWSQSLSVVFDITSTKYTVCVAWCGAN